MSIKVDRCIGIDLGTTHSCVTLLDVDGHELILAKDRHGRAVIPSILGWDPQSQKFITGFEAWHRRGMDPEPIVSIKRKMGLEETVKLGPHKLSPETVSAHILRAMKTLIQEDLERKRRNEFQIQRAVITVPAYFDAPQIEATRRAGEEAGLKVLALLQEPTAACIYVSWKRNLKDGYFLVYDLGGGTFDVSVIHALYGEYRVLSIHGDNYLGGDDFDRRLAEFFRKHLVNQGYDLNLNIDENPEDALKFMVLTRIARQTKEALSNVEVQYVAHRDIFKDHKDQWVTLELDFSRNQWDSMMEDLIDQTIQLGQEALRMAREKEGIELKDIDYVLLVGGSTKSPLVQKKVQQAFCQSSKAKHFIMESPDTCVALGAALYAANTSGLTWIDHDQDMQLEIDTPMGSSLPWIKCSGALLGKKIDQMTSVILSDELGQTIDVEDLKSEGDQKRFKFSKIPLPEQGRHPHDLECLNEDGETVYTWHVDFYHYVDWRQSGSALSNPTVLAKDIYLEVSKYGEVVREKLIAKGTPLPTNQTFEFFTGDQSGIVILNLLQNHYPIHQLVIQVPQDLPIGTPVTLTLHIDAKMTILAEGKIHNQHFEASIEPPSARIRKNWEQIEALLEEAETLGEQVWGYEEVYYKHKVPLLIQGIREAAQIDPDKLHILVARLEEALVNLRGWRKEGLQPSWDKYNALLNNIRRRVLRGDQILGMGFGEWKEKLRRLEDEAQKIYDRQDQDAWTQAYIQIQALYESVDQDDRRFIPINSDAYLKQLMSNIEILADQLRSQLQTFVLPKDAQHLKIYEKRLASIQNRLDRDVLQKFRTYQKNWQNTPERRGELEHLESLLRQLLKELQSLSHLGKVRTR